MWRFLISQDVPGIVIGSVLSAWLAAVPIGAWIHRVTESRHKEKIAAITSALRSAQEPPAPRP